MKAYAFGTDWTQILKHSLRLSTKLIPWFCLFGQNLPFRPLTWIFIFRSQTWFSMRSSASPVMHLCSFQWAYSMLGKHFQSLSKQNFIKCWHTHHGIRLPSMGSKMPALFTLLFLTTVFAKATWRDHSHHLSQDKKPTIKFGLLSVASGLVPMQSGFKSCLCLVIWIWWQWKKTCFMPSSAKLSKVLNAYQLVWWTGPHDRSLTAVVGTS